MLWYGHDPSGWSWFMTALGMIFFWSVLIVLGVVLFRTLSRPAGSGTPTGPVQHGSTAEQLLAERYARGEIDEDDYRRRLNVLHGDGGPRLGKD